MYKTWHEFTPKVGPYCTAESTLEHLLEDFINNTVQQCENWNNSMQRGAMLESRDVSVAEEPPAKSQLNNENIKCKYS